MVSTVYVLGEGGGGGEFHSSGVMTCYQTYMYMFRLCDTGQRITVPDSSRKL